MPKFTVPLTGEYDTRISKTNAVSGASGIVGVGIVGLMVVGSVPTAVDKDERWINAMLTKMGGRNYAIKRPGMAASTTPAAGNIGTAILVWTGSASGTAVISAFGATNSTIYNGTTSLGAITGKARSIAETFVSTTATLLVPSTDSTAWYYDTGVGTMTKIADGDFPGNAGYTTAGDFAVLNGYACIMTTDGKLWASDLNSVTGWTANSFDSANAYPDAGVGAVRFKNLVMAFGKESIQFFQSAGLTPFPLQNVPSMTQKIGAVSSDAIATLSDNVFWCGSTDKGGLSIFQYDGNVSRISTPQQDFQFAIAGPSNISLTTLRVYGRSFVLVIGASTTYVYCVEDKRWHEWSGSSRLWYKSAGLSSGSQILSYFVSNISTSGKVYVVNPASLVFTDDGAPFTASIQSGSTEASGYWMFIDFIRIIADQEAVSSTLTVSYSDDDYQTFTVAGTVDMSSNEKRLDRLGSSKQRVWKLTHSDNASFRIEKVVGEMSIGT